MNHTIPVILILVCALLFSTISFVRADAYTNKQDCISSCITASGGDCRYCVSRPDLHMASEIHCNQCDAATKKSYNSCLDKCVADYNSAQNSPAASPPTPNYITPTASSITPIPTPTTSNGRLKFPDDEDLGAPQRTVADAEPAEKALAKELEAVRHSNGFQNFKNAASKALNVTGKDNMADAFADLSSKGPIGLITAHDLFAAMLKNTNSIENTKTHSPLSYYDILTTDATAAMNDPILKNSGSSISKELINYQLKASVLFSDGLAALSKPKTTVMNWIRGHPLSKAKLDLNGRNFVNELASADINSGR